MNSPSTKPVVKVCAHTDCSERGSEDVYESLRNACADEADIRKTTDCFRFCRQGVNVAVDGAVLHHVCSRDAVARIRSEIRHPSKNRDAVGTKSLDDLDDVLESLIP